MYTFTWYNEFSKVSINTSGTSTRALARTSAYGKESQGFSRVYCVVFYIVNVIFRHLLLFVFLWNSNLTYHCCFVSFLYFSRYLCILRRLVSRLGYYSRPIIICIPIVHKLILLVHKCIIQSFVLQNNLLVFSCSLVVQPLHML